jgi:hypothetical protein
MSNRIMLMFEHPACGEIVVDLHLPLPEPIVESADAMGERLRPACPICKQPMRYVGFSYDEEMVLHDKLEKLKEALQEALGGWSGAIGGFPWSPDSEKRDRARITELEGLL